MIQTMEVADEDKYDFDPLDDTKTWPEDIFPLQPVGRMVLNKNPDNFFNENEQVAFCPALIVPGTHGNSCCTACNDQTAFWLLLTGVAAVALQHACTLVTKCDSFF